MSAEANPAEKLPAIALPRHASDSRDDTIEPSEAPLTDPRQLEERANTAMRDLLEEGSSARTAATYRSAIRYWAGWYTARYARAFTLPLPAAAVLQFLVDHVGRTHADGIRSELPPEIDAALVASGIKSRPGRPSLNTVLLRLSVLSKAHALNGLPNPCHEPAVRELIAKGRSAYAKRGELPRKKQALTREPLEIVLATCDASMRGVRDRALLLFAWASGGRRRSEVTQATLENVHRVQGGFRYTLSYSKTNQSGADRADNAKLIVGPAAKALDAWLAASGIAEGAIFRRIRKDGAVGEPLAPAAVRAIVQKRCVQAGLVGDFSAHSLRSGFITEAAGQDVPLGDIMAMTGQTSVKTVMGYYQAGRLGSSRALRLLDQAADED